eukprot:scaffold1861_cov111-Isochrysis_galbana.AAC.4
MSSSSYAHRHTEHSSASSSPLATESASALVHSTAAASARRVATSSLPTATALTMVTAGA